MKSSKENKACDYIPEGFGLSVRPDSKINDKHTDNAISDSDKLWSGVVVTFVSDNDICDMIHLVPN